MIFCSRTYPYWISSTKFPLSSILTTKRWQHIRNFCCFDIQKNVWPNTKILNFLLPILAKNVEKMSLEMRKFWQEELLECIQLYLSGNLNYSFVKKSQQTHDICCCMVAKKRLWNYQHPQFLRIFKEKRWKNFSRDAHILTERTCWNHSAFSVWKLELLFRQEMSIEPWYLLLHGRKKVFVELSTCPIFWQIHGKTLKKEVALEMNYIFELASFFCVSYIRLTSMIMDVKNISDAS